MTVPTFVQGITLELTHYSTHMIDMIQESLKDHKIGVTAKSCMVDYDNAMIEITYPDGETVVESIDDGVARDLSNRFTFCNLTRYALPDQSYEFVEWLILTYGDAVVHGELSLGEVLTESFVTEHYRVVDKPVLIDRKFITRWADKGVVCKTDVITRSQATLLGADDERAEYISFNYPVIIMGGAIFFNQSFPAPHMLVHHLNRVSSLPPIVAGGTYYETTGVTQITTDDGKVTFEYDGIMYQADTVGPTPIN